jgi:hypothetical protein
MDAKFHWQANITFHGTAEQFNELAELLEKYQIDVEVPEFIEVVGAAGGMRVPVELLFPQEQLKALVKEMPAIDIRFIRDIRGGIRTPHLHLEDRVILLDKERFVQFAGEAAQRLAEMRASHIEDYAEVMGPISKITPAM